MCVVVLFCIFAFQKVAKNGKKLERIWCNRTTPSMIKRIAVQVVQMNFSTFFTQTLAE